MTEFTKFLLIVETTNDAFSGHVGKELSRILSNAAKRVKDARKLTDININHLMDVNGNSVGTVYICDDLEVEGID